MKTKNMIKLLKVEVEMLQFIDKWENKGINIFKNVNVGNYNIFYYILDKLHVPEDSSITPRDDYNNAYYWFYSQDNKLKDKDYKNFIKEIKDLRDNKNENT
mgnify:CR=1 FL=1